MTEVLVQVENLSRFYQNHRAISHLSFTLKAGEVLGFLGPNGAGKSTTIRTLLRFLHPTRGTARVLGTDDSLEIRRRTGYLPADLGMYPAMTGRQLVRFLGALRGFDDWPKVEALAERFSLDLDRRVGSYSTGNKRKVGIVQAFMHEPELLVLDEPTTGLDPVTEIHLMRTLRQLMEGRTTILITHRLIAMEMMDQILVLDRGRVVERGNHCELHANDGLYRQLYEAQQLTLSSELGIRN